MNINRVGDQFSVLESLHHKEPLSIGTIIAKVLSTNGNMTVVINNLEKAQFIERHLDPSDSRKRIILIIKQAKDEIESKEDAHFILLLKQSMI